MTFVVADRVKETTTTTGTGTILLSGAVSGFKTFSSTMAVNDYTYYAIVGTTQWEVGLGFLATSSTLTRQVVFSNSNNNTSFVNFSAGTKSVFITLPAQQSPGLTYGSSIEGIGGSFTNYVAIGDFSQINGSLSVAVGRSALASDSASALGAGANAGASATAVGRLANSSGSSSVAIGNSSTASGSSSVAIGNSSTASITDGVAIGRQATSNSEGLAIGADSSSFLESSSSSPTSGIVVGRASNSYGGITIGNSSVPGSSGERSIVIGHGISVVEPDATYMNKFRTGVTPVGTSWFLKWDDSTKEVYADPGGSPSGPNWYTYQDGGVSMALSLALPSGTPATSSFGTNNWLQYTSTSTPTGWSFGSSYFFSGVSYSTFSGISYPLPDPTLGGSFSGFAVSYYAGYESDPGTTATSQVYTSTSGYSNFSTSVTTGTFSLFGAAGSQIGHAIVMIAGGDYTTAVTMGSGATLAEAAYDAQWNNTYVFVDMDSTLVSSLSSGSGTILNIGSFASYNLLLWYNYA